MVLLYCIHVCNLFTTFINVIYLRFLFYYKIWNTIYLIFMLILNRITCSCIGNERHQNNIWQKEFGQENLN